MTDFSVNIPKDTIEIKDNELSFEIKGDPKYGLDKTIINGIRRILLSSLPSIAFDTDSKNPDLVMVTNNSALHNEYLLHRLSLIPLHINPDEWKKDLLFKLDVKNDTNNIKIITAEDFDIYEMKPSVKENDDINQGVNIDNYDLTKKLNNKEKENIFKPFKVGSYNSYCIFTELPSKTSDENTPHIELYGSPSKNFAYKDVRWQPVSCAVYSFKEDEQLFEKTFREKLKIYNIPQENAQVFKNELKIEEGERYFHRDINLQPYWYNFKIVSQGYYPPNMSDKGEGLLVRSCNILIDSFESIKEDLKKLLENDPECSMDIKQTDNELIFKIKCQGLGDTEGSILQSHVCNKLINDDSILSLCGYKRLHPLEDIITFTLSLNNKNNIVKLNNIQKINAIVEQLIQSCNEISLIYQKIKDECSKF